MQIPGDEFDLELELAEDSQGYTTIVGVTIRRQAGVTASMLRQIPLGSLQALMNTTHFERLLQDAPAGPGHLRATAQIYRERVAKGLPPAPAIAQLLGVKVRTAHGYIQQARKAGLLPPAHKGRAG